MSDLHHMMTSIGASGIMTPSKGYMLTCACQKLTMNSPSAPTAGMQEVQNPSDTVFTAQAIDPDHILLSYEEGTTSIGQ
jgi:hypothetical protein